MRLPPLKICCTIQYAQTYFSHAKTFIYLVYNFFQKLFRPLLDAAAASFKRPLSDESYRPKQMPAGSQNSSPRAPFSNCSKLLKWGQQKNSWVRQLANASNYDIISLGEIVQNMMDGIILLRENYKDLINKTSR